MNKDDKNTSIKANNKSERDTRLAEALRENLRRRKQQARSQKNEQKN